MKNTELLRNHYISLLCKKIKAEKSNITCETAEDIFKYLQYLAKEKVEYGDEKTSWLDITTKKMLAKIIDPDCRLEYTVVERTKTELAIEAKLYWSDSEHPAGIGYVKRSLTQLVTNENTASQIEIEFEALVRGAAATRALTDAGIGLAFYGDGFDSLFEEIEEQEVDRRLERKAEESKAQFNKAVPDIPSAEERKAATRKRNAEKKATEAEKATTPVEEPTTLPSSVNEATAEATETVSTEETTVPVAEPIAPSPSLTVEEAKMVIADMGNFKGQPLGLIYEANPRNLVWLVRNNSAVADAARVIAEADDRLAQFLN